MKLIKYQKLSPGFSLIEILAVLFVVSTALLGVVSLIIQNIQVQSINKNNLIASNLAQEGIELIRQTRDANWRSGNNYLYNLNDGTYMIDYRMDKPSAPSTSGAKIFLKNGFYVNDSGSEGNLTPTVFTREIILEKQAGYTGSPLQVRALISWTDRTKPYSYELRTLLFDWK